MSEERVRQILSAQFEAAHVDALLKHYTAASEKYVEGDAEAVALKAGKFVEAVTKVLMRFAGKTLPAPRKFSAGVELRHLDQLDSAKFADSIRITVPRACIFMYDIASNRGGRHDPSGVDANEMDARALLPTMSWVLAELVRLAGAADTTEAMLVIDEVTSKILPFFEKIGDRTYINFEKMSAPEVALMLLYESDPKSITRGDLVEAVGRHGHKKKAAEMAVHRLKDSVDENGNELKLRGIGRQKAEEILKKRRKFR